MLRKHASTLCMCNVEKNCETQRMWCVFGLPYRLSARVAFAVRRMSLLSTSLERTLAKGEPRCYRSARKCTSRSSKSSENANAEEVINQPTKCFHYVNYDVVFIGPFIANQISHTLYTHRWRCNGIVALTFRLLSSLACETRCSFHFLSTLKAQCGKLLCHRRLRASSVPACMLANGDEMEMI